MKEYRVTKYNPKNRNSQGHYPIPTEWTEFGDVGELVTIEEYEIVESSYLEAAFMFLNEAGVKSLKIKSLEDYQKKCPFKEDDEVESEQIKTVIKSILRNEYWCMLEGDNAFIHLGYDYYMFVGVPESTINLIEQVQLRGLFVEEFISPFHPEDC